MLETLVFLILTDSFNLVSQSYFLFYLLNKQFYKRLCSYHRFKWVHVGQKKKKETNISNSISIFICNSTLINY